MTSSRQTSSRIGRRFLACRAELKGGGGHSRHGKCEDICQCCLIKYFGRERANKRLYNNATRAPLERAVPESSRTGRHEPYKGVGASKAVPTWWNYVAYRILYIFPWRPNAQVFHLTTDEHAAAMLKGEGGGRLDASLSGIRATTKVFRWEYGMTGPKSDDGAAICLFFSMDKF